MSRRRQATRLAVLASSLNLVAKTAGRWRKAVHRIAVGGSTGEAKTSPPRMTSRARATERARCVRSAKYSPFPTIPLAPHLSLALPPPLVSRSTPRSGSTRERAGERVSARDRRESHHIALHYITLHHITSHHITLHPTLPPPLVLSRSLVRHSASLPSPLSLDPLPNHRSSPN